MFYCFYINNNLLFAFERRAIKRHFVTNRNNPKPRILLKYLPNNCKEMELKLIAKCPNNAHLMNYKEPTHSWLIPIAKINGCDAITRHCDNSSLAWPPLVSSNDELGSQSSTSRSCRKRFSGTARQSTKHNSKYCFLTLENNRADVINRGQ